MLSELLARYGYLAVVIGTFFEGETVLVMAGFAAHQGYLELPWVIVAAFAGSLAGDQTAFFAGRRFGPRVIARWPRLAGGVARANALLARYGTALLVGFRFVYGIRNVTPLAAGLGEISTLRFVALNVVGAALWASAVAACGYLFGRGFEATIEKAKRYEEIVLVTLVAVGVIVALVRFVRRRRRERA